MPGEIPRYPHDCPRCVWLGQQGRADLYWCSQGALPTVIARTGAAGDYVSGMVFARQHPATYPELAEALRRAEAQGLSCD